MQMSEAAKLRKAWGEKPCSHSSVEKEYSLGTATGDYVCTSCGQAGWGRDWNQTDQVKEDEY